MVIPSPSRALAGPLIDTVSVLTMSGVKKGSGRAHYGAKVRQSVCETYAASYLRVTGKVLTSSDLPPLSKGCLGDPAISEAWAVFEAIYPCGLPEHHVVHRMDRKQFVKLLKRWWKRWAETRECEHESRRKTVNLTQDEVIELAHELATPAKVHDKFKRFKTLEDAMKHKPRVKQLVEKSGCLTTMTLLHKHLLNEVPELQHGPEDRAPELCTSTLKSRRKLAEVWRGHEPWFLMPGDPCRRSARVQLHMQASSSNDQVAQNHLPVYWRPEWFGQHCFMLDALSFNNAKGGMWNKADHVYSSTKDVWGPTEVQRDLGVSEATTLMTYAVIHKFMGRVVGPDIMFTGSRMKMSAKEKKASAADLPFVKQARFEEAGINTWYASRKISQLDSCYVAVGG